MARLLVSHRIAELGMLPAIMPVLCRHCATPLAAKPFMIMVYFDQHEIQCSHIECEKGQDAEWARCYKRGEK